MVDLPSRLPTGLGLEFGNQEFSADKKVGRKVKLMRIGVLGHEKPAIAVDEASYVDVSDLISDFDSDFFASGDIDALRIAFEHRVSQNKIQVIGSQRIAAPFARPHQIICIGLNYADHAKESGAEVPPEPIIFTKAPNTLIGPNDEVVIPKNSKKTDWEVELGVVVGKRARYLDSPESAADHIAGYVLCNDISEREFQLERQGQWSKGKSSETFNPAGPWLVTQDEVTDPSDLSMTLKLNGKLMQNSTTAQMVFQPHFLVYYLSQFMVLEPGDLINTGTPPGVGLGQKPPLYLSEGDVMELHIQGLGTQTQRVVGFTG